MSRYTEVSCDALEMSSGAEMDLMDFRISSVGTQSGLWPDRKLLLALMNMAIRSPIRQRFQTNEPLKLPAF